MPYPVLPPDPPPVVEILPAEGEINPALVSPIASTRATAASADPYSSVLAQPSVPETSPLETSTTRTAPTLVEFSREDSNQSVVLGESIEVEASIDQVIRQSAPGSVDPLITESRAAFSTTPSVTLSELKDSSSSLPELFPTTSRSTLRTFWQSAATPPVVEPNPEIVNLAAIDPQELDPNFVDLSQVPPRSFEPAVTEEAATPEESEAFSQPFQQAIEQSWAAAVPMFERLEQEVIALSQASPPVSQLPLNEDDAPELNYPPDPNLDQPGTPIEPLDVPTIDEDPTVPSLDSLPEPTTEPQQEIQIIPGEPPATDSPSDPADPTVPADPQTTTDPDSSAPDSGEVLEVPLSPTGVGEPIELDADYQEYDVDRQVFIAEGNVEMRFRDSVLNADRLLVNLINRTAVAEGNIALLTEQQLLQGERIQYDFVREEGDVTGASGEIVLEEVQPEYAPTLPRSNTTQASDLLGIETPLDPPPGDAVTAQQPPLRVTQAGQVVVGVGVGTTASASTGNVRRLRFEADTIDFYPGGWEAENVRITNDPFSPPELELRATTARFTRLSTTRSEIRAENPRIVIDQSFVIPLLRDRVIIDDRERNPALVQFGFDEEDRGGFFIERTFEVVSEPAVRFELTPQYYVQRAIDSENGFFNSSVFGLESILEVYITPTTTLVGQAELYTFDFDELSDNMRASVRLSQLIYDHTLSVEYSYRDRLFNGSLGFQDVERSFGFVLASPIYTLGNSGILLNYQFGIQEINANIASDRQEDLLPPAPRENNRATLTRYQASFAVQRPFILWTGTPLPATAEEGLRYTPTPVVPYIAFNPRLLGTASFYSSGDEQPILTGIIGFSGQFGHFSRPAFDYLGFNISYSHTLEGPDSPFNFDRKRDRQILSGGLTAQLIGPIRIGFQTSFNIEEGEEISTTYYLQYVRRTFSVNLAFNPERETGSFGLQINDFNWSGQTEPFDSPAPEI